MTRGRIFLLGFSCTPKTTNITNTTNEWFLVPLFVVNEVVDRIKDGTIIGYRYDPKAAALVRVDKT
jgi:hypothetical protein